MVVLMKLMTIVVIPLRNLQYVDDRTQPLTFFIFVSFKASFIFLVFEVWIKRNEQREKEELTEEICRKNIKI
jgi:hypothetical protein